MGRRVIRSEHEGRNDGERAEGRGGKGAEVRWREIYEGWGLWGIREGGFSGGDLVATSIWWR